MKKIISILTLILCLSFSQDVFGEDINTDANELTFLKNSESEMIVYLSPENDIIWGMKDKEILKVTSNGDFYVEGRLTTNDKEIYQKFKEWLDYIMELIEDYP